MLGHILLYLHYVGLILSKHGGMMQTLKDLCKSTLLHTYMTSHKVLNFAEKDNVAIVVYNAEN